jgi:arylsulfatase A-like enzyme
MKHVLFWVALVGAGCRGGESARRPAAAPRADLAPPVASSPSLPSERVLLDLIANRPLAHVAVADAQLLDPGGPGFATYVDGGWKSSWELGARDGDRRVSYLLGVAGVVRFPLPDAAARRLFFTLKPGVARQALTVFLNEKPIANLTIADGYGGYEAALPPALLRAGENTVRFHFRGAGTLDGRHSAAAFERIAVAPDGARDPGAAPRLGQPYGLGGDVRRALAAAAPVRFSYYLALPSGARPLALRFAYGSQMVGTAGAPAVEAVVRVTVDGAAPRELWRAPAGATWRSADVDLTPLAGDAVRLDLELRGGGGALGEPRLVDGGPPPPPRPPAGKPADHVIVWMVDTLRADRLDLYDAATVVKTPAYDALAAAGARFASATVQGNYSLPSHTSLLTGTYPVVHKMIDDNARLSPSVALVSERFHAAGFATALFSANGYISDKWGFRRGWDAYRNFIREDLPNSATEVWKAARPWLETQVKLGRRTFMYLATVDPHVAYNPPADFLRRFWPKPYLGPVKPPQTGEQLAAIKLGRLKLGPVDKQYLEALYDAEVAQNDAALAKVIEDLGTLGLLERTAIVLVSDHGDEFFDHGSVGHGHSVYQELVDVPLILRYPPRVPAGRVVAADVEALDVAPTLLDLAGLEAPPEMQGESLLALAGGAARMPRPAMSSHGTVLRGLRLGRFKLVTSAARTALYDLTADRHELHDLAPTRPVALRAVRDVFALEYAHEARWRKRLWGVAGDLKPAFADELE